MKRFLLLSYLFFVVSFSNANDSTNGYFTAKVFLPNQDTFITVVHLNKYDGDFIKYLYMENFGHYLDRKNKIKKLDANKINGFEVKIDDKEFTFISKAKKEDHNKKLFFHLLNNKSSPVKLYEFYNPAVMASALVVGFWVAPELVDVHFAIEYNNGADQNIIYFPKRKDFRYDKLAFILSDNKELEKKIEEQIYKYDDMPLIITEYNNWYSTK